VSESQPHQEQLKGCYQITQSRRLNVVETIFFFWLSLKCLRNIARKYRTVASVKLIQQFLSTAAGYTTLLCCLWYC
jgi:hypothetical protein